METKSKEYFKAALLKMGLPTYGVDMPDASNSVTNAALAGFEEVDRELLRLNSQIYVKSQEVLQARVLMDSLQNTIGELETRLKIKTDSDEQNKILVQKLKEQVEKLSK